MATPHAGSWFGLPDYGITEAIGGLLGGGRTAQGGSNLNNSGAPTAQLPNNNGGFTPVQGPGLGWEQQSSPIPNPGQTLGAKTSNPSNSTGGGGYSGSSSIPSTQSIVPSVDPLLSEINNAYNARINSLNNISNILQNQFPSYQQDANNQYNAQKSTLDASKTTTSQQIDNAGTEAAQRKDDALSSARRAYNDSLIGAQQRFGAGNSAFGAFGEIASRALQQGFGQARNAYESAQRQIEQQKTGLEERYNAGLLQLQAIRDSAINTARRNLDNQFLEIERMRGEAEDAKTNKRLAVLQDYRQNLFDVNSQLAQYKMQLDNELSQGYNEINQATQLFNQLGTGAQDSAQNVPNQLSYNVPIGGYGSEGVQQPQYIGQIKKEDQYPDVLSSARNAYSSLTA